MADGEAIRLHGISKAYWVLPPSSSTMFRAVGHAVALPVVEHPLAAACNTQLGDKAGATREQWESGGGSRGHGWPPLCLIWELAQMCALSLFL